MEFPGFDALYELSDPSPFLATRGMVALLDYESVVGLLRGDRTSERPIAIQLEHEMVGEDVVWLDRYTGALISQRVVAILQAASITGWTTYPIALFTLNGRRVEGYSGLAVTGRCGAINWGRSQRFVPEDKDQPFILCRGCFFDPDSWDGSDLFLWEPYPHFEQFADYPFATERVLSVLEREGITNVWARRLTEIELYIPKEDLSG
jgi:hypothetical protein